MLDQKLFDRLSVETLTHVHVPIHFHTGTPSPWAVLLVKFSDDPVADPDRKIYERLFTDAGSGTDNMVDFFANMSHGRLDLSGSKVFGWYRLTQPRSDYVGNTYPAPAGKLNRSGLVDAARAAATAAGVDLSLFSGVVVSAYGSTDLCGWIGGMTALCDQGSLQPSLLGQEMGHGYGLDHARVDGSEADYQDPWDVMSTAAWPSYEEPNADYTNIGPGLNAHCMRSRGWLDESRVWASSAYGYDTTITLRPLHWHGLPGYLAAEIGQYLVEFRVPERWDAAIDEAAVLVHRFQDNHSYLMHADDGRLSLTQGSTFTVGDSNYPFRSFYRVTVTGIDPQTRTATLHVKYRPASPPPNEQLVGTLLGGVTVDGGGFLVLPGGGIVPIPPRGPVTELATLVGKLAQSEITGDVALALATRRSLLRSIVAVSLDLSAEADFVSEGPPRIEDRQERQDGQERQRG